MPISLDSLGCQKQDGVDHGRSRCPLTGNTCIRIGERREAGLRRSRKPVLWLVASAVLLAGCAGVATKHGGGGNQQVEGGSVAFALPPSATPNWIMPIETPGYTASYNAAIQQILYVPLYA